MNKKNKKFFKFLSVFFSYFYQGWKTSLLKKYSKNFIAEFKASVTRLYAGLLNTQIRPIHIHDTQWEKLFLTTSGLYQSFILKKSFTYSIILPVQEMTPFLLRRTLESICKQSATNLEILIGTNVPLSEELVKILEEYKKNDGHSIQFFFLPEKRNVVELTNALAMKANGSFLLLVNPGDWIRPDLLFRYEQTLCLFDEPENHVLYCDIEQINDQGYIVPLSRYPSRPLHFPLFFQLSLFRGVLISKVLWDKVGGYDSESLGAEEEALFFKLDIAKAQFHSLPFTFYFVKEDPNFLRDQKKQHIFIDAFKKYSEKKQLGWELVPGFQKHTIRAIPKISFSKSIQVIIPYKDQKELTLQCVQKILEQENVKFKITAIDNNSKDKTIGEIIQKWGGEVLNFQEPFNFSRINNFAVKETQIAKDCEVLLFLNNDVELEKNALIEMLRWIDQPTIGMVGCRLHYPDGRLQHGGIDLESPSHAEQMIWAHCEKFKVFEEMNITKSLGVFDAVTAACAMMKKDIFIKVGGFDEKWYPIAYSDTNLAVKIKQLGLKCFYTPYAVGIHHESVSRKTAIEDFEQSWWLHHLVSRHSHSIKEL